MRVIGLIALSILGVCGCADPSAFEQPITSFSTSSASAATSFAAIDVASTANLNALRADAALVTRRVNPGSSECEANSTSCELFYTDPTTGNTAVYTPSLMPKTVAVVSGIKDYADALVALEKADASSDVQAAFAKSITAASAIAGAVNPAAGVAGNAISTPVSSVGGWIFLQYQNNLKIDALQKATAKADGIIQSVKHIIDDELKSDNDMEVSKLLQALRAKHDAFADAPSADALQAEIAAAKNLNALLSAKAPSFFDSLADAHAKLAAAIANPKIDITQVMADLTALAQQAQNVQKIVSTLAPQKSPPPKAAPKNPPPKAAPAQMKKK